MRIVNCDNAEHYSWKAVCDGWHLLNMNELSIIAEKMPPNTFEDIHFHHRARQFKGLTYTASGRKIFRCVKEHFRMKNMCESNL